MTTDLSGHQVGRYRTESLIGAGGMGSVYRAFDTSLERRVALKILAPELTANPDRLGRFLQEAKAASVLTHPHLLSIYEVGSDSLGDGTIHFIAMELVEGPTLRDVLQKRDLTIRRTLEIMSQVAEAVTAAHSVGIIHRDLKPENIMITSSGYAKVLDFGLAKLSPSAPEEEDSRTEIRRTSPGMVVGTAGYMSPEQARGRSVDARSDIFSIGCILYEMVAGRRAFDGDSSVQILSRVIEAEPEPLSAMRPDAPLDLQRIVSKALAKDPEERYQSVKDLTIDLRHLIRELDSNPHVVTVSSSGTHASIPSRPATLRWIVAAGIVAAIAVAAVLWRGDSAVVAPATPSAVMKIQRLTSLGDVISATISPDGKLIAYVLSSQGKQSLWVRQIESGSELQIVPPEQVAYWSHTFSPDGDSIIFGARNSDYPEGAFYEISSLGGAPRFLVQGIDSPPSFSPDGARMTWVAADGPAESSLVVSNRDGSGRRKIASRSLPHRFAPIFYTGPSWSPDGRTIAVAEISNEGTLEGRIIGVDPETGAEAVISAGWNALTQVAWLPDGSGLLAVAESSGAPKGVSQLWLIPLEGEPRPVTNDLLDYRIVSLSADGERLVTVASEADSAIWRLPIDGDGRPERLSRERLDGIAGLALLPDGGLLYTTLRGDTLALASSDSSGSNRRIVKEEVAELRYPAVAADGRSAVYVAVSTRGTELRWANLDDPRQERTLAVPIARTPVAISPDGSHAFFTDDKGDLKSVPTAGGAVRSFALDGWAYSPAVSPDGSMIAVILSGEAATHLVTLPVGGGPISWRREATWPRAAASLRWAPDGQALLVNTMPTDRSNIWRVPLHGPEERLTSFEEQTAGYFDVSSDGPHLVLTRYTNSRDAVLITGFR